ncbi:glycoside hydrolase family 73 protein [Limnobacter litoralis]|uniref:Mannosyl-glycoprotein endo-beta-N-acetylglucosamidase-like domain-containing protein n=1 Tax=Limnobacter litoralis TaxID=481366 RepID=A0ABQ5YW94_9BURK|nr:glucosaminidase domain-containing protein [Limnobacter litoralis]GLR27491.1 hypothetical protein GCM10007875_25820 [Limnobacter litoralis]
MPHRYLQAVKHPTSHVQIFIDHHLKDAVLVSKGFGVPVSVILAQSALETGWGSHVIDNAFFGVKGSSRSGKTTRFVTHEVINGKSHRLAANFRGYPTYKQAAREYAQVIRRNFADALPYKNDPIGFVEHLQRYATDPQYIAKLKSIIQHHNLHALDLNQ